MDYNDLKGQERDEGEVEEELRLKRTNTIFATKKGSKVCIDDFHLLKVLGRGAFGKVMLVQKKDDEEYFALKSLRKDEIIDKE